MSNEQDIESRRRFLKVAAGTTAAAMILGGLPRMARAADLPPLPATDPTAKALDYVEDNTKSANAKHKAGDDCTNCQFYSGGATGRGPCQLFPGHSVNAKGWCVSHTPKKA
ncbi:MAG: high-potential iron-sulfur protein [Rhodanobacter sp.]